MKQENIDSLIKKFPFIKGREQDLEYVNDGWYNVLAVLCSTIERNLWTSLNEKGATIKIFQIKQKLGGLRFYYELEGDKDDSSFKKIQDRIYGAVDMAEAMSYFVCEHCGDQGKLCSIKGWLTAACNKCEAQHAKK